MTRDEAKGVQSWTAHARFDGPHAGIVRSVHWDEDAGILLSGGEDGTLCAWSCPSLISEDAKMEDTEVEQEGGLGGRGVLRESSESMDDGMDVDFPRTKRSRKEMDGVGSRGMSFEHVIFFFSLGERFTNQVL
jgi:hypothetical protein